MAGEERFHRVLVAVDGSEVSRRASEHAARIAQEERAELVAVHIVPAPPAEVPGELADYYESARKKARKWLEAVGATATAHGLALRSEVLVGASSVVDALLGYAEDIGADLIVTGTRGTTPSHRIVVGSVASGLVEYAKCAVLVIR